MPLEKVVPYIPQVLTTLVGKIMSSAHTDTLIPSIINDKNTQALTDTLNSLANQSKAIVNVQNKIQDSSVNLCSEAIKIVQKGSFPQKKLADASRLFYHQG